MWPVAKSGTNGDPHNGRDPVSIGKAIPVPRTQGPDAA